MRLLAVGLVLSGAIGAVLAVATSFSTPLMLARGDSTEVAHFAMLRDEDTDPWDKPWGISQGSIPGRIVHCSGPDGRWDTADDLEVVCYFHETPWALHVLSLPSATWLLVPAALAWVALWNRAPRTRDLRPEGLRCLAMAAGPACAGWVALWWLCEERWSWQRPWRLDPSALPPWLIVPWTRVAAVLCLVLPLLLCFWLRTRRNEDEEARKPLRSEQEGLAA